MQAAIGLVQLEKLPGWLSRRRRNAALLDSLLADAPMLRLAIPPEHVVHPRYTYYAFLDPAQVPEGRVRDDLVAAMTALTMPCASGYCPAIPKKAAFTASHTRPCRRLPKPQQLCLTSLTLPGIYILHDPYRTLS